MSHPKQTTPNSSEGQLTPLFARLTGLSRRAWIRKDPQRGGSFTRPAVSRRQHSLRHGLLVALCALGLQTSPWWQLLRPLSPSFTVMLSKRNESIQQRIPVDSGWRSKCPYYWLCITDLIWFSSCWLSRSPPRPRGRKFINGKSEV